MYEFEPNRWSYKLSGTSSGETFPSRAAALIAGEQAKDKQAQAAAAVPDPADKDPSI